MTAVFLVLIAALFLYEGVALYRHRGETISEIFWRASNRPLIPFAMGFLMGHLFFWK